MKLRFDRLEMRNFMSYEEESFDFDLDWGLTLVCGKNKDIKGSKNGCGKSLLFGALVYGLFGQLPNKVKAENIANRYAKDKDVRVCVWLSSNDVKYKAVTTLNKRAQSSFSLYRLDLDGENDITKSSIAETRDFFERDVLGCDLSIFLRTIYLSDDDSYNFYRLKSAAKKEFIEKLFDISIFGEMFDAIHRDVLTSDRQLISKQNQLLVLNRSDEEYKAKTKAFDERHAKAVEDASASLADVRKNYETKSKHIAVKNEKLVSQCDAAISKADAQIEKLEESVRDARSESKADKAQRDRVDARVKQLEDVMAKHSKVMDKLCADCQKVFSRYYRLDEYKAELGKLSEWLSKSDERQLAAAEKIKSAQVKIAEYEEKRDKIAEQKRKLEKDFNADMAKLKSLETEVAVLERELKRLSSETNPYVELLEANKAKMDALSKETDDLVSECRYLKFAENIVSQDTLKKFIIKDLIVMLNSRIKFYLGRLGSNYTVVFDENMDYTFVTTAGNCEFDNFSAGEQMRIVIATSLSFRDFMATRSNITSNILVIDEYIDSNIDTLAINNIFDILKEFVKDYGQNIFLISHRKEIDNTLFDNIVQVEKSKNISHVKYLTEPASRV